MAPPGDEALYASPPSSPGPATPPLRATLLDNCDVVSPLSLPEAHLPSVLSTHREKPDLGAASQLPFTIPTPSPPAPRRRKDIAQGMLLSLHIAKKREDECLEPGTGCICCYPHDRDDIWKGQYPLARFWKHHFCGSAKLLATLSTLTATSNTDRHR